MDPNFQKELVVTFGVLADVQYADCNDRVSDGSKTRFYRGALTQVDEAFKFWGKFPCKVQFVLQLGDIIDGLSKVNGGSHFCLNNILSGFEKNSSIPTFHTVGNHELYNFNRKELASLFYDSMTKMEIPSDVFCPTKPTVDACPKLYYKFCPVPNIKCISLDCFDISVLGYDDSHPKYQEAARVLRSKHGHAIFEDWDCEGHLKGLEVRFQQMNGAIGQEQLTWLEEELKESDDIGQRVIVFGHVSLNPDSTDWSCLLWNYDDVVNIFHRHSCVVAYLCGHTHESGYAVDAHGISYVAFAGIVETPPETTAFATVSVYKESMEIKGHGLECSYSIPLSRSEDVVIENESDFTVKEVEVEV